MEKTPSASTLTRLLRSRRTVYAFRPERAPRDALDRALDAARWAPNHRLTEPWRFYVLGPETAEAVCALNAQRVERKKGPKAAADKLSRWRTMPGWAVITCQSSPDPIQAREDYGEGFPIATGIIEGACRHLVKDRMDITGTRWQLRSAEAVLKLRSTAIPRPTGRFTRLKSRRVTTFHGWRATTFERLPHPSARRAWQARRTRSGMVP